MGVFGGPDHESDVIFVIYDVNFAFLAIFSPTVVLTKFEFGVLNYGINAIVLARIQTFESNLTE